MISCCSFLFSSWHYFMSTWLSVELQNFKHALVRLPAIAQLAAILLFQHTSSERSSNFLKCRLVQPHSPWPESWQIRLPSHWHLLPINSIGFLSTRAWLLKLWTLDQQQQVTQEVFRNAESWARPYIYKADCLSTRSPGNLRMLCLRSVLWSSGFHLQGRSEWQNKTQGTKANVFLQSLLLFLKTPSVLCPGSFVSYQFTLALPLAFFAGFTSVTSSTSLFIY